LVRLKKWTRKGKVAAWWTVSWFVNFQIEIELAGQASSLPFGLGRVELYVAKTTHNRVVKAA
jgi:hypothetical protein